MTATDAPASVWQAHGFRRLATAWVFTNVGDSALYLMAAVWVKELTGSDVQAGFVFVFLGIPAVLAPFLGMLADRVSRKGLLVATNVVIVPIVLALLAVDGPERVWVVYAVILLYGAAGYLTAAAQAGIIRGMLSDDQLAAGNGTLSTIDNTFRLLAPLVGTALYVGVGPFAVVALTAGSFGVAAIVLAGVPSSGQPDAAGERRGVVRELTAGFEQLFRPRALRLVTLSLVIAFGATGLLNIVVFPLLDDIGVDPAAIGVLVPVQGAGAVLGGILSSRLVTRLGERRAAALGLMLIAAGTICFLVPQLPAAIVGMVVMGFGIPVTVVAFATLRQRVTPDRLQGRTAAAGNVAINLPQTALSVVGAGLLTVADYRVLIAATALAVLAGVVLALRAGRRRDPIAAA